MMVKEVQVLAHKEGLLLHQYLDDWFLRHQSLRTLVEHIDKLVASCTRLSFALNLEKS